MEKIFIDYVGPLLQSKSGNKFMLVCLDTFSKFGLLSTLRNATAQLTVQILHTHLFQHIGKPATIVSYYSTQFVSYYYP